MVRPEGLSQSTIPLTPIGNRTRDRSTYVIGTCQKSGKERSRKSLIRYVCFRLYILR
jgi:hypothetical protein